MHINHQIFIFDRLLKIEEKVLEAEIKELIPSLKSNDVNLRMNAISKLGKIKSDISLHHLLYSVKREVDINARITIIRAIGNHGTLNNEVDEALLWNTRDTNSEVRRVSIEALGTVNSKILPKVLLERLEDFDQNIRFFSIDMIGDKRLKECSGALISILNKSSDNQTIIRASQALGKIKDPKAIQPLFAKFQTGPPDVRIHLSQILQFFGENPKENFLRVLSESNDVQLLQLSIGVLEKIDGEDVMEPIAKKLLHPDQSVRNAARTAMINLKGATKYVIKEFLEDPHNPTIHETLQHKGKTAVEYLLNLRSREEEAVSTNANNVLNMLVQHYQNLLSSGSPQHKIEATEVYLKLFDGNYPIPNLDVVKTQIINNLSFDEANVRKISIRAVRKVGDATAVNAVESILKTSTDRDIIIETLKTLGEFQDSKPIEAIRDKYKSDVVEVRKEAVIALGRIGHKNPSLVGDYLSEILYDPDHKIKLEAIRIAEELRTKRAIRPLKELALHGPTNEINESASSALDNLQQHFIEVVSDSSSRDLLLDSIEGLISIERSNEKVIEALFNVVTRFPDKIIRRRAVEGLGILGNENILERLDMIDVAEPGVREAKEQALNKIKQLTITSETAIERLRKGDVPDEENEILSILRKHDHNIFGPYADDIDKQLSKAVEHFENKNWGEFLNRMNNICEDIVKEIFKKRGMR